MNIGIDLDDTINNLSVTLIEYATRYNEETNIKHDLQPYEWEFDKAFGWNEQHAKRFIEKYIHRVYLDAEPKEHSVEILNKLKEDGHKLIIITARSDREVKHAYQYSEEWLKKHEIPYDKIVTNSYDKAEKCIENNIDIFVDDRLKHCEDVKNNTHIPVFLFDSVYNKNHESTGIKRVFSWQEIYYEINNKL